MTTNTRRIAKNTLMLYFRQILIMLVSLYTVRVVLNTLGAEDYGIYNVAAGVVAIFGFLSSSMVIVNQRYFSFEIGRGDLGHLKRLFSVSFMISVFIAALFLIAAETIGPWMISNKISLPLNRKDAALMVFQVSVLSYIFTILAAPYIAIIIAHEDMNIYAYISIVEAILKLTSVLVLRFISFDKMQLYGILMCAIVFINMLIHQIICFKKYHECRLKFYWDKKLIKEMAVYTSWNIFGAISTTCQNQGITILLNQFSTPIVIAARGIASSVNTAIVSFSGNFYNAMRPQIIKSYSASKKDEMLSLVFSGAKITYFLVFVIVLPLTIEMPFVFTLWLKEVPDYVVIFTKLSVCETLIHSITFPLGAVAHATGKIRIYQTIVYGILLLNLPLSWVCLSFGAAPYIVMVVAICLASIAVPAQLFVVRFISNFPVLRFSKDVILPLVFVSILSAVLPVFLTVVLEGSFLRFFLIVLGSIFSSVCCMYFIGLNKQEKRQMRIFIWKKL
jgi:O-antigen/teichoic acid export membrane protein